MKMVTFKELKTVFGIPYTPQHIQRLWKALKFPRPRKFGNRNYWFYADVVRWIEGMWVPPLPSTTDSSE